MSCRLAFIAEITMMCANKLDGIVCMLLKIGFRGVLCISGNLAQLLPVIPNAGFKQQVSTCISHATSWNRFNHFLLRGQQRTTDCELHEAVHRIGYGEWPHKTSESAIDNSNVRVIELPTALFPAVVDSKPTLANMRQWIHPTMFEQVPRADASGTRTLIVAATNPLANEHNDHFHEMLQTPMHTMTSSIFRGR